MDEPLPKRSRWPGSKPAPVTHAAQLEAQEQKVSTKPEKIVKTGQPRRPVEKPAALEEELTWPVFDSQRQCSAATGIPEHIIKAAKDKGCLAFKSNRVYMAALLRWISANILTDPESALADWNEEGKMWRSKLAKLDFEERNGELISKTRIQTGLRRGMDLLFSSIHREFSVQLPPQLKGLDAPAIAERMTRVCEQFKAIVRTELDKIVDTEPVEVISNGSVSVNNNQNT